MLLWMCNLSGTESIFRANSVGLSNLTPRIHQGIWPDFCLHHVLSYPEECSCWGENKQHPPNLELNIYGYSHAHIDKKLIARLGHLIYLIPTSEKKNRCDFALCSLCQQPVVRSIMCVENEDFDEDEPDSYIYPRFYYTPLYQCPCTNKWWLYIEVLNNEEMDIYEQWKFCYAETIYHGYLDWNNKIYFNHLKNLLLYTEKNLNCSCFWPQLHPDACTISDLVFEGLQNTLESFSENKLSEHFAPHYFKNEEINTPSPKAWIYPYPWKDGGKRTLKEVLSGVLTHAFFYTHYRNILLDFDQFAFRELSPIEYLSMHRKLVDLEEQIQTPFLNLYFDPVPISDITNDSDQNYRITKQPDPSRRNFKVMQIAPSKSYKHHNQHNNREELIACPREQELQRN